MAEHFDKLMSVFQEALEKYPPEEWDGFVREASGDDEELYRQACQLLQAHAYGDSLLDRPAVAASRTLDEPITEKPGAQIGPYKLLQQIGEGGMGVVFMAEQTEPIQRTVALKIIKPGMDTRQVIARFEAERQAVAMMDHPNIAKVLDAGTTESGRPYFVMELVKGMPITKYCDEKLLPIRARLELFVQVCQAVQHAHQKGIIHRDIKPNNVLVAEYDNRAVPKVIDFGVAKATAHRLTERTMFTEFGQVLGTLEYMSPEQSKFNQLDIDTRSDIYSLGVLLYELLAGSTPFEGKRLHAAAFDEMLRIIREEEPPKPSTRLSSIDTLPSIAANRHTEPARLSKDVRGELDWIVMKALEKDRNRRYETASGFAADIERHLHDEPVEACPPSATYRLKKFVRRNKAGVLAGTAIAAALIVGLGLAFYGLVEARRQARIAKAEAEKATAIKNILQSGLQSASPYASKGSGYTVRELLNDISNTLGNKLADQPEVEIELRTTIGSSYRYLLNPASAEPHLKRALELARRIYGPDHVKVAAVLFCYSQAINDQGKRAEAEDAIREALRIYRLHKESGPPFLDAMSWHCVLLHKHGKTAESEAVAREALAIADASGKEYSETASILNVLSDVKQLQNEYVAAEQFARRAVEILRRLDGPEARTTSNALHSLGAALASSKKYAESESAFREALTIDRRNCDVKHWAVRSALAGLTAALRAQGKEEALKELETEQQEWAARRDTDRLTVIAGLVRQLEDAPAWKPQVEIAERAAMTSQYVPRAQRETIAAAILGHARSIFHCWNEDYQSARRLADLAIQVYRPEAAEDPSEANLLGLAESLCLSGWAETELGMFPQSQLTLREALQVLDGAIDRLATSGAIQQAQAMAHRLLGDALARQKPTEEAIGHCRSAVAIMSALNQDGPPQASYTEQFVYARLTLADALVSAASLEAAAAEYRAAMAAIERAAADFPNQTWVGETAADCLERMARGLPNLAHENPAQSQEAHRLVVEAMEQIPKLNGTLKPTNYAMRVALANGYINGIRYLANDMQWAAEVAQAEQGFQVLLADLHGPGRFWAWRHLSFRLPRDPRNLPRIEAAIREAIGEFEAMDADSPGDSGSWNHLAGTVLDLGSICQKRQQFKEAEAAFRRAVEIYDNKGGSPTQRAASYSALASLLAENGRTTEAIDYFDRAIKLNSSSLEPWVSRSQFNADLGRWDKAAEDLTQAGTLTSVAERPELWAQLALLRLAAHDEAAYRQTCATLVEKSLPNNPRGDQAFRIAWACVLLPDAGVDPGQVVRIAQAAVAANAKDPDYLIALGAALYRAGRHEEAAKTLADAEAAYQHEQTTPTPGIYVITTITYCHLFLAMTHQRLDHHEKAEALLKKAVEEIDVLANSPRAADYPWNRRLALEVLRKEAESLITHVSTEGDKEDAAKTPG